MTTSLLNHIALDWIRSLDLVDSVQTEFGHELKGGTQLSALVPRIAHQVETLRRCSGQSQVQHVATGSSQEYSGSQQDEPPADGQVMYVNGSGQVRGNNWRPGRGQGRGFRPTYSSNRGGGRNYATRANYASGGTGTRNSHCPSCRYLGQALNLQVNSNHTPADCPRRRANTNMVMGEHLPGDEHENENDPNFQDLQQEIADIVLDDHSEVLSSLHPKNDFSSCNSCPTNFSTRPPDLSTSPSNNTHLSFNDQTLMKTGLTSAMSK